MLFKIKTPSLRPHYVERVRHCLNHVTLSTALHPRAAQHLGGIPGHLPNTEQEESQEQAGNQRGTALARPGAAATKLDSRAPSPAAGMLGSLVGISGGDHDGRTRRG